MTSPTTPRRQFRPGDLITADFVNKLLDRIEQMDGRLTALEHGGPSTGGAPLLTGRSPAGDVVLGSRLTLTGANFLVPAQQNTVTIGPATVTQFFGTSSDTSLIFNVPTAIQGVSPPALLPVQVHNRNGESNTLTIRVVPIGVIPQGSSQVTNRTGPLGVIAVGGTYTLQFLLDSATDVPETYLLSPVFADVTGASEAAWRSGTVLVPAGQQLVSRGTPLAVTMTVTVPAGATSASVALRAESVHNDTELTTTSPPLVLTTGQIPELNDLRTSLTLPDVGPAAPDHRIATINNLRGVEVRFGRTVQIEVNARFSEDGRYRFAADIAAPGPGGLWTVGTVSPQGTTFKPANGTQTITIQLTRAATGAQGDLRTLVVRAIRRDSTDTADQWQSLIRVPIRDFS